MSGGIAYIYNPNETFEKMHNPVMIDLEPMDDEAQKELKEMLTKHSKYTGSKVANLILNNWDEEIINFVKVMPKDLKMVLNNSKDKFVVNL